MPTALIDNDKMEFLYRSNSARMLDNVSEDFHRRLRDKLINQGFKGLKLSFSSILAHMSFAGTRLVDIAELNGMTKQAVGQIANELEALNYIARVPDPRDGRAKNLVFTKLGQRLIQASFEAVEEVEQEYAELIGKEKMTQLETLLRELAEQLDQTRL